VGRRAGRKLGASLTVPSGDSFRNSGAFPSAVCDLPRLLFECARCDPGGARRWRSRRSGALDVMRLLELAARQQPEAPYDSVVVRGFSLESHFSNKHRRTSAYNLFSPRIRKERSAAHDHRTGTFDSFCKTSRGLARRRKAALDGGGTVLHCDVMDGHFVPNITIGAVGRGLAKESSSQHHPRLPPDDRTP